MELQKSAVKLPQIRLTQQPILRKAHFVNLGWIITSRKTYKRNMEEPAFPVSYHLLMTHAWENQKNYFLSFSHIFWFYSKWKTKCYFEFFFLVEWESCLCYYSRAKKFLLRLRKNMKPPIPHFFQIPKLFIANGVSLRKMFCLLHYEQELETFPLI